ncbi:LOW QUALITY PROTEIN: olfactory receptor 10G3 [Trichechus inunguis]
MERVNSTLLTEFILTGIPYSIRLGMFLFVFFLFIYILTQLGNLLILITVHAHPMYIFLGVLSIIDMGISSIIVPRLTMNFTVGIKPIPFGGCVDQLYFYHFLGSTQCFLYTLMAYDRYLAICQPLHYPVLITAKLSTLLVAGAWVAGSIHRAFQAILTFRLPYCGPNQVNYFFCVAVLRLACADTTVNKLVTFVEIGVVFASCFSLILLSYIKIIQAILRIHTADGQHRAFSTCGAHVTLVTVYYVPSAFIYLRPETNTPLDGAAALFLTAITPFLNPLIYTLWNQEVKLALKRMIRGPGTKSEV